MHWPLQLQQNRSTSHQLTTHPPIGAGVVLCDKVSEHDELYNISVMDLTVRDDTLHTCARPWAGEYMKHQSGAGCLSPTCLSIWPRVCAWLVMVCMGVVCGLRILSRENITLKTERGFGLFSNCTVVCLQVNTSISGTGCDMTWHDLRGCVSVVSGHSLA